MYDFVTLISTYNDNITDLVVGIPLYSVRDIGESNMYAIEKAKNLFEEKTQNGLLEELMQTMGRTLRDEPDLHMMMEE